MEYPTSPAQHNIPRPGSPHRITVHRSGCVEIEAGPALGHQGHSFRTSVPETHDVSNNSGSTDYEQIRSAMSRVQAPLRPFNTTLGGPGKQIVNGEEGEGTGLGTSSKTVLLALKSLQEKIQRLENERDGALKERDLLRKHNATDRAEMELRAESQAVEVLNRDTATRLAHERLFADKSALEINLIRVQEQNATISRELDEVRAITDSETRKRRHAEEEIRSLQLRINALEQDSTVEALHRKFINMEGALATECTLRREAEMRLSALKDAKSDVNEFLEGILKANEVITSISCLPPSPRNRRETTVPQVSKLAKPGPSRQRTITSQNGMKNTTKKIREGLPSTGRSMNTMNRRSNEAAAAVLAESAQAAARNKGNVAQTSKNRGISERGEGDAYRSSSRRRVQSATTSSSQLPSTRPFLPPGSDKAVAETRRSGPGPGHEEDYDIYAALVERLRGSIGDVPHLFDMMSEAEMEHLQYHYNNGQRKTIIVPTRATDNNNDETVKNYVEHRHCT